MSEHTPPTTPDTVTVEVTLSHGGRTTTATVTVPAAPIASSRPQWLTQAARRAAAAATDTAADQLQADLQADLRAATDTDTGQPGGGV